MSSLTWTAGTNLGLQMRAMRAEDIEAVAAIERDIYEFPWTPGNFSDSLSAGYDLWLHEGAGGLLGYLVFMRSVDEVHLLNLSVARRFQGQGIGKAQLRWLCAKVCGGPATRIILEVRPSNQVARHLYESHGFERIGVRKRYYPAAGNTREDALVLSWRVVS